MAGFPGRQGREVDLVYKSLGRCIPREEKKSHASIQCFESGSAWIRSILAVNRSVSVLEMRIRIQEQGTWLKVTNEPDFKPFKMTFIPR